MTFLLFVETQYTVTPTSAVGSSTASTAFDITVVQDQPIAVPPWLKRHVPTTEANAPQPIHEPRRAPDRITFRDLEKSRVSGPHRLDLITYSNGTVSFIEVKTPWLVETKSEAQKLDPVWAIYQLVSPSTSEQPSFLTWPAGPSNDPLQGYEAYDTPDWDGYGAEPITPQTLSAARAFLRILPEGPLSDLVEVLAWRRRFRRFGVAHERWTTPQTLHRHWTGPHLEGVLAIGVGRNRNCTPENVRTDHPERTHGPIRETGCVTMPLQDGEPADDWDIWLSRKRQAGEPTKLVRLIT